MFKRRRHAASPVSLLVVAVVFAWACSSGDHDATVTTGGGLGTEVNAGSAAVTESEGGEPSDAAGSGFGSAPVASAGGAANASGGSGNGEPEPGTSGSAPVAGGASGMPNVGGAPPFEAGGSAGIGAAGASNVAGMGSAAGSVASAGTGSAGAPVVEVSCTPTSNSSTEGLNLPCAVSAAFFVCRHCHSNPPAKSVNKPYVTFQDIKPMAAEIYGVVKSGYMPWPPYTMGVTQRATVLAWLGKDGSCAVGTTEVCN